MKDGDVVIIEDSRGRNLEGTFRSFEQDGETRYELVDVTERRGAPYNDEQHHAAIGLLPEDVK